MSPAQRTMLFKLFSQLCGARKVAGVAGRDLFREKITLDLFGGPRSWSLFDNGDVDRMKMRLLALLDPDNLDAQMHDAAAAPDGERRRLVTRIESDMARAGFHEGYLRTIAVEMYDRGDWRALDLAALENLRDTIAARTRRKVGSRKSKIEKPDNIPF